MFPRVSNSLPKNHNASKSNLVLHQHEIEFLDFIIFKENIQEPYKVWNNFQIEKINEFLRCSMFISFTNFYQIIIKEYYKIAISLTQVHLQIQAWMQ